MPKARLKLPQELENLLASDWERVLSDYCAVAREYGVDRPDYYAKMARAFLMDRDGVGAEKKIEAYDRCVAKG